MTCDTFLGKCYLYSPLNILAKGFSHSVYLARRTWKSNHVIRLYSLEIASLILSAPKNIKNIFLMQLPAAEDIQKLPPGCAIRIPQNLDVVHCVKCVQIRSFFWSVFSCIRTEYGPEKTPYLDTFQAVVTFRYSGNLLSAFWCSRNV